MATLNESTFDRFPVLHTPRLTLRELRVDADAAEALRLYSDPAVVKPLGKAPLQDLQQARDALARNQRLFPDKTGIKWALTLRDDDRLLGTVGHWRLMKEHLRSEIGYELAADCWGRGYMAEALNAVLAFGFDQLGLHSVEAHIDPNNQRSRRALERAGFRLDGVLRENFYYDGQFSDTPIFTLLRREFTATAAPYAAS